MTRQSDDQEACCACQVDYVDIWSNHTPYPFNQLPKTYSFMVRNSLMWRIGYYGQQPRFIHVPTQTISSLFVSKQVSAAFDKYQPDLVVSVHPLMQLVPLRVLRQQARWADWNRLLFFLAALLRKMGLSSPDARWCWACCSQFCIAC